MPEHDDFVPASCGWTVVSCEPGNRARWYDCDYYNEPLAGWLYQWDERYQIGQWLVVTTVEGMIDPVRNESRWDDPYGHSIWAVVDHPKSWLWRYYRTLKQIKPRAKRIAQIEARKAKEKV